MYSAHIPAWRAAPFFRLLPAFITGILIQTTFTIHFFYWASFFLLGVIWTALQNYLSIKQGIRFSKITGLVIWAIIVCSSALVTVLNSPDANSNWFYKNTDSASGGIIKLVEDPIRQGEKYRAIGEVIGLIKNRQIIATSGKTFVYFTLHQNNLPQYGELLLVRDTVHPLAQRLNPGGFNFAKYASRKGIYGAWYIHENNIHTLCKDKNLLQSFVNNSRIRILKVLQHHLTDKNVLGIAEALLIGYREHLDKEVLQSYANTGVVHVIAISGLHLGLVYVVIKWIIHLLPVLKKRPKWKWPIILFCLWWFALVTGASASVLRSATMFSFMLIGETFFKSVGSKNVLTSSAFVLLAFQPLLLWDVGFLLSYGAVAGLIWWQQPIKRLLVFKKRWVQKIWEMTSVTIAAQLAVTPLCIYYFNQFPTWFLIANLIIVPLATIVLISLLIMVLISFIPPLATTISWPIKWLINMMNGVIHSIEHWPLSTISGIFSNEITTLLLYGFILLGTSVVLFKKNHYLLPSLSCLFLLSLYMSVKKAIASAKNEISIYNIRDGLSIDFISGRTCTHLNTASSAANNPFPVEAAARTIRLVEMQNQISIKHKITGLSFLKKQIIIIGPEVRRLKKGKPVQSDIVILFGSPSITISQIVDVFNPHTMVLAADNKKWKIEKWKSECEDLHLRCISIRDSGAYIFK